MVSSYLFATKTRYIFLPPCVLHALSVAFCCALFGGGGLNAQDIRKEIFLFTVRSVCRVKREILSTTFESHKWNWDAQVAEATAKRLLCCGFRNTGKAMEQLYQCWWRICREINVLFQVRIFHVLRFISICDLITDSPLKSYKIMVL
jgi:hypothetical protein